MRHRPLVCLALTLAAAGAAFAAPEAEDPGLDVTLVTDAVSVPVSMAFIGTDDFLVIEKDTGRVQRFAAGVKSTVLDLAVNHGGERGLLGIAVHPDFAAAMGAKPWVYLYYTPSTSPTADIDDEFAVGTNQVDRFTWNGSVLTDKTPILTLPSDSGFHNGGALAFGPDAKLYGVIGDGGGSINDGQLQNNAAGAAPDDTSIVFRLNDDGSLPADNPFDADMDQLDPEDKIYAYGIRNSFGLAFDPIDGRLWDSENGVSQFDELNLVARGFNSGWRDVMGPATPNPPAGLASLPGSAYADPAYSIQDVVAPTGLAFASSNSSLGSGYVGDLFVGDFNLGQIYRFELEPGRVALEVGDLVANTQNELDQHRFARGFTEGVADVKEGPDGALYVVAIGLGGIYKIEGAGGPVVHDLAVASVKALSRAALSASRPLVMGRMTVTVANTGTATETVANQGELEALVSVTGTALTGDCPTAPTPVLAPPKKGFPVTLPPRKKLKLSYSLEFDCAAADPAEVEFEWDVAVALTGDAVAANDVCPRPAAGDDKGCGGKPAGSPIRTDVSMK